ncbi:hypothetical protein [Streptosporangium amethystogenes]|uniref:hypothetical protein n=1 Tax=Streptosporangium amethystogenes TaxID=2002 RepID=UPI0004C8930E|nr:hypothetical protein [Streptosporangium amethystogenes]
MAEPTPGRQPAGFAVDSVRFPAVPRARDADGRERSQEASTNRGSSQRPFSVGEPAAKFGDNAEGRPPAAAMDAVTDRVARLDELDNIGDLLRLVAEPQHATGDGRD